MLKPAMISSKRTLLSIWPEIPWPGSYSFIISWSKTQFLSVCLNISASIICLIGQRVGGMGASSSRVLALSQEYLYPKCWVRLLRLVFHFQLLISQISSISLCLGMNQGRYISPGTFSISSDFNYSNQMSEYSHLLKMLFNSWKRTHELSARIVDEQLRRNSIKRLEGNYRKFQHQVTSHYGPQQEIEHGLIRYHHNLSQAQYRMILQYNYQLGSKIFKLNPFPRREENFQINRSHKSKINLMDFLAQ